MQIAVNISFELLTAVFGLFGKWRCMKKGQYHLSFEDDHPFKRISYILLLQRIDNVLFLYLGTGIEHGRTDNNKYGSNDRENTHP